MIKESLMCSADTTILTMRWLDYALIPTFNRTSPHTCVDWSRIEDWTRENWVDTRAEGMMVVFTSDGKNNVSRIGVSRAHQRLFDHVEAVDWQHGLIAVSRVE